MSGNRKRVKSSSENRQHLFADIPRGQYAGYIGSPPDAHFESTENLAATQSLRFDPNGNRESKLFLGVVDGDIVTGPRLADGRVPRWVEGGTPIGIADDRHVVTIGGSRGGKGRSALIPNLLLLPPTTSLVCIDPKGDLCRATARYRADVLGQQTGVLDPFGVAGTQAERYQLAFNPIDVLLRSNERTFVPNAKLIADSLITSGDFKDRHWDDCGKAALSMLCGHVATHPNYENYRNLVTVWHLIAELAAPDPDNPRRYWLERELVANDAAGGSIRNAARQFYDRTGGEFSSVLSNLRKHTDFLGIECMEKCLTGPSVDLRQLKRGSLALYVTLPAMRMHDLSGWLRLVVQMALAAHEEVPQCDSPSTVFVLDEFNVMGRLECLAIAAAQIAGLNAKIWAVLQDIGQLQNRYSKSWETFIANAGVVQVFSLADLTTLEYVSKCLGQSMTMTRSSNSPSFDQAAKEAATGASWSLGVHPLMTPDEIGRFFARNDHQLRQLILRPGYRPAILQRVFYDKHEMFHNRFDVE